MLLDQHKIYESMALAQRSGDLMEFLAGLAVGAAAIIVVLGAFFILFLLKFWNRF